ncbi:MAG TPA: rhomboid family intramembrane serine protease, partial [Chitinivibrionales bacterium]|nr:rhomboid family intramembrane serine protease [Chitinivibrionales bacterium]
LKSLVLFAIYNLSIGAAVPFIDNSAHLGGLACGLILGAVLARHLTSAPEERASWRRWVFIVGAVVLFAMFELIRKSVVHA